MRIALAGLLLVLSTPQRAPSQDPLERLRALPAIAHAPDHTAILVATGEALPYALIEGPLAMAGDRVLVRTHHADAVAARHGCTVIRIVAPGLALMGVKIDDVIARVHAGQHGLGAILAALAADADVAYAEPDFLRFGGQQVTPNDPDYETLWGLPQIRAPLAWTIGTDASGIAVGVIDTGVDYTHEDLTANIWTNLGEVPANDLDDDGNGYVDDVNGWDFYSRDADPADEFGHGTHCAGTIGARGGNLRGVVGVCWSTRIACLKVGGANGAMDDAGLVEAVNYATRMDMRVTSNSYGGPGYSQSMYEAIAAANARGFLFIAAAGNSSMNTDAYPNYPSNYDLPNIISVGASTGADTMASFSNHGLATVDLFAPGEDINSTTPGSRYETMSGTSMAAPHVSGAAALLWARNVDRDGAWVKNRLLASAAPRPAFAGYCVTGALLDIGGAITAVGPTVTIMQPSADTNVPATLIDFMGTAEDPDGSVDAVAWTNLSTGATGAADGKGAWIASEIPLQMGTNLIEIRATDNDGFIGTATRLITREAEFPVSPSAIYITVPYLQPSSNVYTVTIMNEGAGTTWTATPASTNWVYLTPPMGGVDAAAQASFTLSINLSGYEPGTYTNSVRVTLGPDFRTIPIAVTVLPAPGSKHKTGMCGSIGIDMAAPLALIWLWKRIRRRR